MTIEVGFSASEATTDDPEATCHNMLEALLLIAMNLESL